MTEKGKAGKIQLPKEIFRSLSSQRARVVVTVLNVRQLGMFEVQAGIAGIPLATGTCYLLTWLRQHCPHAGDQPDRAGPG